MSETDAFSVSFKSIDDPLGQKQWVPADLARRLERERDEARNEILGWENKWKYAIEIAARAELERDDALAELDNMQNQRDFAMKVIHRLEKERDEAMEALMKIEDLFIDGTDIYADRENMGMIAKKALEETK